MPKINVNNIYQITRHSPVLSSEQPIIVQAVKNTPNKIRLRKLHNLLLE